MALIAIVFAALGTAIGSRLQNMQGFQLIMNFLVMPIYFLSGALYPLTNLPAALGDRHADRSADLRHRRPARRLHRRRRTSAPPPTWRCMSVVAVVFLALGARSFAKIQI